MLSMAIVTSCVPPMLYKPARLSSSLWFVFFTYLCLLESMVCISHVSLTPRVYGLYFSRIFVSSSLWFVFLTYLCLLSGHLHMFLMSLHLCYIMVLFVAIFKIPVQNRQVFNQMGLKRALGILSVSSYKLVKHCFVKSLTLLLHSKK